MGFIVKRLFAAVITLFLISVVTFAAFRLIPGDAALLSLGTEATQEQIDALRAEMGLDKNAGLQYLNWLVNYLMGRLGNSSRFRGAPISGIILQRLPVTLSLSALSFLLILFIAVPVSLLSVKKENSIIDRIVTALTALGISTPGFFLGVLFIWVFGVLLKLFIPGRYVSYSENIFAFLGCLVFPALAIAIPNAALVVKFLRTSIFHEFRCDYARTARSKGGSRSRVLRRHVLKNACLPSITLLGMIAGEILSGSIVIEHVFGIPGIGRLLLASINARDYSTIGALMIYITFTVVLANTIADIVIQIIDPRIRLQKKV